jgi:hypothetical protein
LNSGSRFHELWVLEIKLGLGDSSKFSCILFLFFKLMFSYFYSFFCFVFLYFLWFYSIRFALNNYFFLISPLPFFLSIKLQVFFQFHPLWFFNLYNLVLILLLANYFVLDHFKFYPQVFLFQISSSFFGFYKYFY